MAGGGRRPELNAKAKCGGISERAPLEETAKTLAEFMTPLPIIQPFVELSGERRHLSGQTSCLHLLEFREKIVRD